MPTAPNQINDHCKQARKAVQIAQTIAFFGAMLGVFFGVVLDAVSTTEIWLIGICALVTGGMLILVSLRPATATDLIAGSLSIFFVIYLNIVAIFAYATTEEIVTVVPYACWFFPLVMFHHFTNLSFHKRLISLLVSAAPLPTVAFVLGHPTAQRSIQDIGAVAGFLASFFAFVLFVDYFTRRRDQEIIRAARAEEAERSAALLRVSEERFRLISRATNDLIWDADLKSGRMWWNDTLRDSYGYDPDAFENDMDAWESWIHPDDRDRVVEGLQSVIESNGSNWASEYRFLCKDGRAIDVVDRGLVLRDDKGQPVRVIGSTTDVSELRSLERKLRHSQKLKAVGQLTGGVAHDFNNLLTIIIGNAETLTEINADNPEARRLAEVTMHAAERGAALISHLLAFARRQTLAPVHLDPGKLLTGIEALVSRTINKSIKIKVKSAPDVWPIEVDPGQLDNAILNLVINARDAMQDGGKVTIEASNVTLEADVPFYTEDFVAGRYVMISVTDNGCGMPRDVTERAFEPFFTTKEVGMGSGLGLSMVWGFVKQSNGHATIHSQPGKGTSVKLFFPAADAKEVQDAAPVTDSGVTGGTEHILVVEDDEMVRTHVAAQLGSLGYDFKAAASPAEALAIMDGGSTFDLLFTDVVMPGGMNGRQFVDAALLRQPHLKVLFTSGHTEDAIVHQGRLDPDVNFLSKPYRRAELAMKIRRVLDA